jgi:hypothetical protein
MRNGEVERGGGCRGRGGEGGSGGEGDEEIINVLDRYAVETR